MRLFKTNDIRQTVSLNGLWKAKKETGEEFDLYVPGCWEMFPVLKDTEEKWNILIK